MSGATADPECAIRDAASLGDGMYSAARSAIQSFEPVCTGRGYAYARKHVQNSRPYSHDRKHRGWARRRRRGGPVGGVSVDRTGASGQRSLHARLQPTQAGWKPAHSLVALLVVESCNIRLMPVTDTGLSGADPQPFSHIDQNYLRADTINAPNATLIAAQPKVPFAQVWGGGMLASVDGLQFVVPPRTINAGPRQSTSLQAGHHLAECAERPRSPETGAMVMPRYPARLPVRPRHPAGPGQRGEAGDVVTDNASYSEMVFGAVQVARQPLVLALRDLADQRFWRVEIPGGEAGQYGPLELIRPQPGQPQEDRDILAGHAAGRRFPHQPTR